MLQNIRIVLVETSHTGNMGSVARADLMAMTDLGPSGLLVMNSDLFGESGAD